MLFFKLSPTVITPYNHFYCTRRHYIFYFTNKVVICLSPLVSSIFIPFSCEPIPSYFYFFAYQHTHSPFYIPFKIIKIGKCERVHLSVGLQAQPIPISCTYSYAHQEAPTNRCSQFTHEFYNLIQNIF